MDPNLIKKLQGNVPNRTQPSPHGKVFPKASSYSYGLRTSELPRKLQIRNGLRLGQMCLLILTLTQTPPSLSRSDRQIRSSTSRTREPTSSRAQQIRHQWWKQHESPVSSSPEFKHRETWPSTTRKARTHQ